MRGLRAAGVGVTPADLPSGGMMLFFLLGLRHGIEPDHLAAIDGLTLRAHDRHERHTPWTGSLFALGHGIAIAGIAVLISGLAGRIRLSPALTAAADWLPIALLALLGAWNLKALLAPGVYRPDSLRMRLVPARLRERSDIGSTIAIGLVFAVAADAMAHLTAWSAFATQGGGWLGGVLAGLLFSTGMLIASTADSQIVARLLRRSGSEAATTRLRRAIGWSVVILSFAVVVRALLTHS